MQISRPNKFLRSSSSSLFSQLLQGPNKTSLNSIKPNMQVSSSNQASNSRKFLNRSSRTRCKLSSKSWHRACLTSRSLNRSPSSPSNSRFCQDKLMRRCLNSTSYSNKCRCSNKISKTSRCPISTRWTTRVCSSCSRPLKVRASSSLKQNVLNLRHTVSKSRCETHSSGKFSRV